MSVNPFFVSSDCSGHGRVEKTPPGSESSFASYGICDEGYSGLADYFDLRVTIKNGTQPSFEATLDCPVSSIGAIIVWSLVLFAYSTRILINIVPLHNKIKVFYGRRTLKPRRSIWKYTPFRVLMTDTIFSLWHLYMCIAKLTEPAGSVLGSSVSVTVAHVFPILGLNVGMLDYELANVLSLANIRTWGKIWNTPFTRVYLLANSNVIILYFVVSIISLVPTGLDRSNGPIASGQLYLLISRNVLVTIYWGMYVLAFARVMRLAKDVRQALSNAPGFSPRSERLIGYLEKSSKDIRRRTMLAVVVYTIMLIPWVYPYQYIGIAVIDSLSGFTGAGIQYLMVQERTANDRDANPTPPRSDNAVESVYVQSITGLAVNQQIESGSSPRRNTVAQLGRPAEQHVIVVGHDSLVAELLNERLALRMSSLLSHPFFKIMMVIVCIAIEVLDSLVLVGVLPPLISVATGGILLIITLFAFSSLLSVSILRKLIWKQAVVLRITFWCLYMIFFNIVMQDERIVMGMAHCLFILLTLFNDAFVKEANGYFGFAISCAAFLMLVKRFVLLQFDLMYPRFNDQVHIAGNLVVWSTYQAARDFCFSLLVLLLKDLLKQHQAARTSGFVHIQSAVIVKIISLSTESKMVFTNSKLMRKFGGIGLSSRTMTQTLKASNVIEGGVLTLKERDSLAIRWFGLKRGEILLRYLGKPWIRWISRTVVALCLFTYVCLVLPGVLPPWVSLFMLLTLLPSFRTLLLKNWALIRALVEKFDFVMEASFALAVLALFGAMLKDERIAALPMLFLMWLDFRLSDAQCVFYHSAHRGNAYQSSRPLFWWHAIFTIVLVFSLLALPAILVTQFVANVDTTLGFNLRGLDVNVTSSVRDDRRGAYAQVRLYQYVSDFLATFAVVATIELLSDMIRKPKSQIILKYFLAPVRKHCVDGFVPAEVTTGKRNNAVVSNIPTVFYSNEDEAVEEDQSQLMKQREVEDLATSHPSPTDE